MRRFLKPVIDLIAPPLCLICKEPSDGVICDDCERKIDKDLKITKNFCLKCGGIFDGLRCPRCRDTKFVFEFNRSVYMYDGAVKELIEDFKYRGIKRVGEFMARKMAELIEQEFPEIDFLIPIPIHPTRKRERGFSQTELMVKELSRSTGIPCDCRSLTRTRHTRVQARLTREERIKNLEGAFSLENPEKFRGKSILLVDDVMTTGTTINEAAKVFKRFRSIKVYSITFAIAVYGSRF